MLNILLILAVIGMAIFLLTRYFLEKQKKAALEDLYKSYFSLLELFKVLPGELKEIIADIYRKIRLSIGEIEVKYENYKKSSDVFEFVDLKKSQGKELERQIREKKKKWEIFDSFMKEVGYTKLNIENLQKDIKRKAQDITISFGEKNLEQEEKEKFINDETEKVIASMDIVYKEYDKMQGINFLNFDIQRLKDLEKLNEIAISDASSYYSLLNLYNKEIEIVLVKLTRRSSFYIKLKELLEGYPSGKNKMANLGEISVSFKNFEKLEEGSRYRQDVFVSGKRAIQEIEAEYKVATGQDGFTHIEKLTYDELLDLLSIGKLKIADEENDENGVAYNFEIEGLEISLAKKEKQELLIEYIRDFDILKRIPTKE